MAVVIALSIILKFITMSEFNFGSLATTQATSSAQPRLKPWGIYNVKFAIIYTMYNICILN